MKFVSLVVAFLSFFAPYSAICEDQKESQAFILRAELDMSFRPQKALFILYDLQSGEYLIREGFLIGQVPVDSTTHAIALLKQSASTQDLPVLEYRVLFLSDDTGDFAMSELYTADEQHGSLLPASSENLRAELAKHRESLERLEAQNLEKEKALERLRKDLSIIGYFNKATELEHETDALKQQTESAKEQRKLYDEFIRAVKREKPPTQFILRKQELAKVTSEVRKMVEEQEVQRMDYSSAQFLADLNLIEETQNENVEELRDELVRLRKLRQEREASHEISRVPVRPPTGFHSFRSPDTSAEMAPQ